MVVLRLGQGKGRSWKRAVLKITLVMIKLWLQGWKRQRDEKQQCVAHEMRNAKPQTQTMKIVLKQLNRKRYTAYGYTMPKRKCCCTNSDQCSVIQDRLEAIGVNHM